MKLLTFAVLLLKLLWACTAYGQVILEKEHNPYQPIKATCQNQPGPGVDVDIGWQSSSASVVFETLHDHDADTDALYIWAPPGKHWIEATVATQKYQILKFRVVDEDDPTKTKVIEVKNAIGFRVDRYKADFTVRGTLPGPDPGPGPTPPPVVVPSAEMQALVAPIKAVMASGDAAKAAIWAGAWGDYLAALRAAPPSSIGLFKAGAKAFTDAVAIKAGLQGAFPGFGAAVEAAMIARFGTEDGTLDPARAAEFVSAIAWACTR